MKPHCLITGAAGGMGAATGRLAAKNGYEMEEALEMAKNSYMQMAPGRIDPDAWESINYYKSKKDSLIKSGASQDEIDIINEEIRSREERYGRHQRLRLRMRDHCLDVGLPVRIYVPDEIGESAGPL